MITEKTLLFFQMADAPTEELDEMGNEIGGNHVEDLSPEINEEGE